MAASYEVVSQIVILIQKYIPKNKIPDFLKDLEDTLFLSKNNSYNETVYRILRKFQDENSKD